MHTTISNTIHHLDPVVLKHDHIVELVSLHMQSYKINMGAHYVAHLKIAETDKLALKEFDHRLPFEVEDLAMAAGLESTIPSRYAFLHCQWGCFRDCSADAHCHDDLVLRDQENDFTLPLLL